MRKTSKKLSLVMALVMLFSIFSTSYGSGLTTEHAREITSSYVQKTTESAITTTSGAIQLIDTTLLKGLLQELESIDESGYTKESIKVLQGVIKTVREFLEKEVITQKEVDEKLLILQQAKEQLKLKGTGNATFVIQRSTLGQPFYLEPTKVDFTEGENVAEVLVRLLGEGNYESTGGPERGFYLSQVKLEDNLPVNIPECIEEFSGLTSDSVYENDDEWLGEFDHTFMSGWIYWVNHVHVPYGMSDATLQDGDVVRLQFTVHGYGADLGLGDSGWGTDMPKYKAVNKDDLIRKIAEINENKTILDTNLYLKYTYDEAVKVIDQLDATKEQVGEKLTNLQKAMAYIPPHTDELERLIEKAREIDKKLYTEESVKDLQLALDEAIELKNKIDKTQEQVNAVIKNLKVKLDALKLLPQEDIGYEAALNNTLALMYENTPRPAIGTSNGEWTVLSLVRGNYPYPQSYMNDYYQRVAQEVKDKKGELHKRKYTEYSRVVLGLTAIGKDVTNIGGYNFLEKLADFDKVIWQGINGTIFGLMALDSHDYEIPKVEGVETLTTRGLLINEILRQELPGGGFNLMGSKVDVDITAMALQALAPYKDRSDVKGAIDRSLTVLSRMQLPEGDFENAFGGAGGGSAPTSESTSQVIVALCTLGIDPRTDSMFVKEKSAVDGLLSYYVKGGGFKHLKDSTIDGMATDQGACALVAYDRFVKQENTLYDMADVEIARADKVALEQLLAKVLDKRDYTKESWDSFIPHYEYAVDVYKDIKANQAEVNKACENLQVAINKLALKEVKEIIVADEKVTIEGNQDENYVIKISPSTVKAEIEIAEAIQGKVTLDLNGITIQRAIQIVRGEDFIVIPKDVVITGNKAVEVFSEVASADPEMIKAKLLEQLEKDTEVTIEKVYGFGGSEPVEFSDYVILTFVGGKNQDAAYIDYLGNLHQIKKVSSLDEGKKYNEFAYVDGNNLQVYTKHFTDFVTYTAKAPEGGGGGGTPQPEKNYITLSIDKLTIDKGYVIAPTQVPFTEGENVWDVLKREMDARGIAYEYEFTPKYGSVYVQSIAGDGEFDHGRWSGWMYNVNGWYPNYGASKYILENGDKLEWRYTTNLGDDLGADNAQWETYPDGTPKFPGGGGALDAIADKGYPQKDSTFVFIEGVKLPKASIIQYKDQDEVSEWAKNSVAIATGLGLVEGFEGYFKPQDAISRAEFTKIIVDVLGLGVEVPDAKVFEDVAISAWYAPYIHTAFKAGIVSGYGNRFKPTQTITRQEVAVIINNILQLEKNDEGQPFEDDQSIGTWAKESVALVASRGIMTGRDNAFYPTVNATREMTTVALVRTYKYINKIQTQEMSVEVAEALDTTTQYMIENVTDPIIGSIGGEWAVFGLARHGAEVPEGYYDAYYERVRAHAIAEEAKTDRKWKTKVTETQRIAIALTAIGKDPSDIGGFNLIDYSWNKGKNMPELSENDQLLGNRQGLNELVFGLITIDLKASKQPVDAVISRDQIINKILATYQTTDGGFNLRENQAVADVDMTAMTLQALAPYYQVEGYEHVTVAVGKALQTLSRVQTSEGAFENAYGGADGGNAATSESTSQVIVALCALGIDPVTDIRFVKNGRSTIDDLMSYYVEGGGFKHLKDAEIDQMATEQAYYALVAYERFLEGKTAIYNMSDVK